MIHLPVRSLNPQLYQGCRAKIDKLEKKLTTLSHSVSLKHTCQFVQFSQVTETLSSD